MARRAFPKRAIHLDFHTMPGIDGLGCEFDPDEFAGTLADCGVDYINVFAKCNLGFAYYPTKVGIPYPGMEKDLLGGMVEGCHRRGIGVSAYFNLGLDHEQLLRHRDWARLDATGSVYDVAAHHHFFRTGCVNTGFGDYILSMVKEVVDTYPVDGIFLDCLFVTPCYGFECLEGMKKQGIDPMDESAAYEYARASYYNYLDRVEAMLGRRADDLYFAYNGTSYKRQPSHLELEVLPCGGWGYDFLPANIRYARTIGKPYLTMTGRFHNGWGDFGGLRPMESTLFDCYYSIANGGGCSIGDHLHPSGRLDPAVYGMVKDVFAKTRELDPWTDGAESLTEVAVVEPAMERFPELYGKDSPAFTDSVRGAARMLSELKVQFDVCDAECDLSKYRVLVLPDHVTLDGALKEKVRAHIAAGKGVISSGTSGLAADGKGFALPDYAINFEGKYPFVESYYKTSPQVSDGIPDMLHSAYKTGISMSAGQGAEILAETYDPYFNMGDWDRRHLYLYAPPDPKPTGKVSAVRCGNIIHISFPVFEAYYGFAAVPDRTLVGNCLRLLLDDPLVRVKGMPSFGQVTLTEQKERGRLICHLLTYVPEHRGAQKEIVEEPVTVQDVRVSVRLDGRSVERVYLAPSGKPLPYEISGGYLSVTVPMVTGYCMLVTDSSR